MSIARRRTPVVFLGIAVFFVAFFSPVLFSGKLMASGDAVSQAIPTFFGRTPLVEPDMMLGYPLFADPNQAYWYPVLRLLRFVPGGFNVFAVFPYVVVAFGTYGFARRFSGSTIGGLAAALAMSLGGFMIGHQHHLMLLHPACWAPYVLWAICALRERPNRAATVAGGVALALGAIAGPPQALVYLASVGIAFAIVFRPRDLERRRAFVLGVATVYALGIGLAAISLVPAVEFTLHSGRAHQSLHDFTVNSTSPLEVPIRLLFPYFLGNAASALYRQPQAIIGSFSENSNYAGVGSLVLAVVALLARGFRRRAAFFACVAAFAAWMSVGQSFGAAAISRLLPVYGAFRIPGRHAFELTFALAILASLGVAAIEAGRVSWRTAGIATVVPGCAMLGALEWFSAAGHQLLLGLSGGFDVSNIPITVSTNAALALPLAMFALFAAALFASKYLEARRFASLLVLAALCADMTTFAWFSYWRENTEPAWIAASPFYVQSMRAALEKDGGRFIDLGGDNEHSISSNLATLWSLPNAAGYVSLEDSAYENLLHVTPTGSLPSQFFDEGAGTTLDLTGIRFLLLPPAPPVSVPLASAFLTSPLGGVVGARSDATQQEVTYRFDAPHSGEAVEFLSALQKSWTIPDGTHVADVAITGAGGSRTFPLIAGRDTSDAAYDSDDVRKLVKHARAQVFGGPKDAHVYITSFRLAPETQVSSLGVKWTYAAGGSMSVVDAGLVDRARGIVYPFYDRGRFANEPSHFSQSPKVTTASGELVYENLRAFPHAWITHRATQQTLAEQLRTVHSGYIEGRAADLHDEVVTAAPVTLDAGDASDRVATIESDPTVQSADVRCRGTCMLVTNDLWYPGWKASVDGVSAKVLSVDYALRGVVVPPGRHRVVLWFAPLTLAIGIALTVFSALFAGAYLGRK